jgi:hypothetical protein
LGGIFCSGSRLTDNRQGKERRNGRLQIELFRGTGPNESANIAAEPLALAFVAEKYGVDRSTISQMMTEIRLKEALNGRIL